MKNENDTISVGEAIKSHDIGLNLSNIDRDTAQTYAKRAFAGAIDSTKLILARTPPSNVSAVNMFFKMGIAINEGRSVSVTDAFVICCNVICVARDAGLEVNEHFVRAAGCLTTISAMCINKNTEFVGDLCFYAAPTTH